MEGRKLQLTGGSTYIVSLPKRWVVGAGLKAGDTVFVEVEADGSVSVRATPRAKPGTRKKVFEEKDGGQRDHLLRALIGAYISAYGLIEIRFRPESGPFVRKVAREFCRMAIGPEVIEETRGSLLIQDLSDPSELSAEKGLRRMHLTVRAMLEDALAAVRDGDAALARDVALRDQDVDRLYWMVAKQYHLAHMEFPIRAGEPSSSGFHNHRLIAKLLERIGDHAERIARTVEVLGDRGLEPKLAKEVDAALHSAVTILDRSFHALVAGDVEEANATIDMRATHQKLVDSLAHHVATKKGPELLAFAAIVDSLGRTAGYATDIAEIAINQAIAADSSAA